MTRRFFIQRTLRQIYGGETSADSNITDNLVNGWLNDVLGVAARKNYTDNYYPSPDIVFGDCHIISI